MASLLQVLDGQHHCTLAQISRQTRVPRSSAHRILQRLVDLGWVERHGFNYSLGIRMFELGVRVVHRDQVHGAALPVMHALYRSTGLTAYLSVLQSTDILHIERVGGWPERAAGWHLGGRQPAVHCAAGRALIARLDEALWPELAVLQPPTSRAICGPTALRRELYRVRDRGGVAIDNEGCVPGTIAVAAPVGPSGAGINAALTLCGPAPAVQTDKAMAAVHAAAMNIWQAAAGVPRRRGQRALATTA
ncbi:IclR family transcriptional regulator [Trebonia kvetii]|uniref:IclR family transcriptional regulator n=1 Tax=Trebonia kvetii TaxID=2480626 RepID=UPI001C9E54A0|nr:IclR family transcriptional regulator [Trebonia kvetii]